MDLASFEENFLQSPKVNNLMSKVKVKGEIELDRHFPQYWAGRVTLKLSNGQLCTHEVIIPKGERLNPITPDEVKEKFLSLAAPVLGAVKAGVVIKEVESLTDRKSLQGLLSALRISS
jgi:2-methylcitrate dehydratase PrpD